MRKFRITGKIKHHQLSAVFIHVLKHNKQEKRTRSCTSPQVQTNVVFTQTDTQSFPRSNKQLPQVANNILQHGHTENQIRSVSVLSPVGSRQAVGYHNRDELHNDYS